MALKKNPKYDLKLKYKRTLEISMILSIGLLVSAFEFFPGLTGSSIEREKPQDVIRAIDEVEITRQDKPLPPPPRPPIPIEAPSDEMDDEDIEFESTELEDNQTQLPPPDPIAQEEEEEIEAIPFYAVQKKPEIIGGIAAIMKLIKYPELAKRAGIQGKVYIEAFVDKEGNVYNAVVVKGIGGGCNEEALAAVMKTKFVPAAQRGKPVPVKLTIPISFQLR